MPKAPPPIRWRPSVEWGVHVPVWVVYVAVVGMFFVFAFTLLHMRTAISGAQKQVVELERQFTRAEEINQSIEVKIDIANDPEKIRAIATNTLHMRIPSTDEVQLIPFFAEHLPETPQRQPSEGGLFGLLLSFFSH